jgi:hypothetical protein
VAGLVGLGVGVDYALFVVARYRENRSDGQDNTAPWSMPWAPQARPSSSRAEPSSSQPHLCDHRSRHPHLDRLATALMVLSAVLPP